MRPSDDKGSFRLHVLQHGTYTISAVAIDDKGNRSEKATTIAIPTHENDVLLVFPEGSDPVTVGTRLGQRFIQTVSSSPHNTRVNYPYVCTYLGAFWFAQAVNNDQMYNDLRTRYDNSFFSANAPTLPTPDHVDNNIFGSVPLEIYKKVKDSKYLNLGMDYADKQWELPANPTPTQQNYHNQGYSWQTRIWIDDMFMITAIQAQAYQTTGDRKYIDRAAKEMAMYLDEIQRPNGLFYHAPDAPFYWGRGNGWMAVGIAELLRILPEDNPDRPKIENAYKLMMSTLLQYQAEDGMWRQLIDKSELWKETSGTAMFTYAMIVGVKKGWLDKVTYGTAARKAWLSLLTYINNDDNITDVCEGTNKNSSYQFYVDRKRNVGDLHGQAPMLWCAYALAADL
ncbi:glycosyl hydrolase [Parapedobacter sp. SGR-10]|nr:glycosyl hydrolase [Parapedobacter sp. SGR-10]